MGKVKVSDVLRFIDGAIERHPECVGVLKTVRYRVERGLREILNEFKDAE